MANIYDPSKQKAGFVSTPGEAEQAEIKLANIKAASDIESGQSAGQGLDRIVAQGKAYFDASRGAYASAVANRKLAEATLEFSAKYDERLRNLTDKNGNPNFQTIPEDLQKISNEIMTKIGGSIKDADILDKFASSFRSYASNQAVQSFSTARALEQDYIKSTLVEAQQNLMQIAALGDTASRTSAKTAFQTQLDDAVQSGAISMLQANQMATEFTQKSSKLAVQNTLLSDPESALAMAESPEKFGLFLEADDRLALKASAKVQLKEQERVLKQQEKEKTYLAKSAKDELARQIAQGARIAPEAFNEVLESLKGTKLESEIPKLTREYEETQEFLALSPAEQEAFISSNEYLKKDLLSSSRTNILRGYAKTQQELKKDPTKFAIDRGFFGKEVTPLDFNSETIVEDLALRKQLAVASSEELGVSVSGFTEEEIDAFEGFLANNVDTPEKTRLLNAIKSTFGDRANDIFKQVSAAQLKDPNMFASKLFLEGNIRGSRAVSDGVKILKEAKPTFKSEDFDIEYADLEVNVGDPTRNAAIYSSVKAAYMAEIAKRGKLGDPTIDTDALETAVSLVRGETVSFGDFEFTVPPGQSKDDFSRKLRSLDLRKVTDAFILKGSAKEKLSGNLNDYILREVDTGSFLVYYVGNGSLPNQVMISDQSGKPKQFVLELK